LCKDVSASTEKTNIVLMLAMFFFVIIVVCELRKKERKKACYKNYPKQFKKSALRYIIVTKHEVGRRKDFELCRFIAKETIYSKLQMFKALRRKKGWICVCVCVFFYLTIRSLGVGTKGYIVLP
jgi:hypothetical protein